MFTKAEPGQSSELECFRVCGEATQDYWSEIEELCQTKDFRNAGELTLEDIKRLMYKGAVQGHVVKEGGKPIAFFATEIINYPQFRVVRLLTCAGNGEAMWPFWDSLESWAHSLDAQFIETIVEPAVARWIMRNVPEFAIQYFVLRTPVKRSFQ